MRKLLIGLALFSSMSSFCAVDCAPTYKKYIKVLLDYQGDYLKLFNGRHEVAFKKATFDGEGSRGLIFSSVSSTGVGYKESYDTEMQKYEYLFSTKDKNRKVIKIGDIVTVNELDDAEAWYPKIKNKKVLEILRTEHDQLHLKLELIREDGFSKKIMNYVDAKEYTLVKSCE